MDTIKGLFKPPDKRLRIIRISQELLLEALINPRIERVLPTLADGEMSTIGGLEERAFHQIKAITVRNLPADARIEAMSHDWARNEVMLRVWSSTFEEVPEGGMIPQLLLELWQHEIVLTKEQVESCHLEVRNRQDLTASLLNLLH